RSDGNLVVASGERYLTAVANQPPVASAGPDQTVECAAGCAEVTLDASRSSDPEGDPLSFEWRENGELVSSAQVATVQLGLGLHVLTLRVTDPAGAFAEDQM